MHTVHVSHMNDLLVLAEEFFWQRGKIPQPAEFRTWLARCYNIGSPDPELEHALNYFRTQIKTD